MKAVYLETVWNFSYHDWHKMVHEYTVDIVSFALNDVHRLLSVSHSDDLHVLIRERQLDDALDGDAVVRQQELMRHGYMIP